VNSIIAPFGEPIEDRPPVPTEEERIAEREAKRRRKEEWRAVRDSGDEAAIEAWRKNDGLRGESGGERLVS